MNQRSILKTIINFIVYLFLQIVIFRTFNILDTAYCFVYVSFIILLPIEFAPILVILLSFAYGLLIDMFYDTLGIHMAASVLIGFLRTHIINFTTPRGGYDASSEISLSSLGFQWMISYTLTLIVIHHLFLFILEAWGFGAVLSILSKTIFTTILTLSVVILFQYLFSPSQKRTT